LDQVLPGVPRLNDPNVLVGFDTADDAGVYRLSPECALVQTIDFFTPIVDDPRTYGRIAAANALSDVYAMGGRPLTALSVVCFPKDGDLDDLKEILHGGAEMMIEAGCAIMGGHSVDDDEIKFGYAVTGLVHPDRIWTNAGARPGDVLVLTKPIGTGAITTALKRGIAKDEHVQSAIDSMSRLNRIEAEAHGCTDITGFGLMGHAREMALASGVTLEFDAAAIELLPGALEYSAAGARPGGQRNNREFASCSVLIVGEIDEALEALLYDPQTSGGLLLAQSPECASGRIIGRVLERGEAAIVVRGG
jgi:selenide,water dikinase